VRSLAVMTPGLVRCCAAGRSRRRRGRVAPNRACTNVSPSSSPATPTRA
jgi:hypothetical protein